MSKPALFITTDSVRGKALVRGVEARPATEAVAADVRQYSPLMRGWVVPLDYVPDLEAFARYYHVLAVTSERKHKEA